MNSQVETVPNKFPRTKLTSLERETFWGSLLLFLTWKRVWSVGKMLLDKYRKSYQACVVVAKMGGRVRLIGIGCAVTFIAGNILYAIPSMLPEGNWRIAVLFISRFMTGASSGSNWLIDHIPFTCYGTVPCINAHQAYRKSETHAK